MTVSLFVDAKLGKKVALQSLEVLDEKRDDDLLRGASGRCTCLSGVTEKWKRNQTIWFRQRK